LIDENAIIVKNVTKTFRIFHEKRNSIYEYLTSFMNKNRNYEELTVLKDISFSIKKGEMIGIIGFNGTGKTTLLKIIGGIYLPDHGEVIKNGRLTPFLELGTGFNGELTARDNIIMYGVILGFTKKEIKKRIDEIVKFAEVERFLDTKLKNFSSGMYARLAFSTAIQGDPDILLIDEVLAVGDIAFQEKSFKKFMEFKEKGKTIVFVSHGRYHMQNCDKVIWLHDGVIRRYGDPTQIMEEYRNFAAEKESS